MSASKYLFHLKHLLNEGRNENALGDRKNALPYILKKPTRNSWDGISILLLNKNICSRLHSLNTSLTQTASRVRNLEAACECCLVSYRPQSSWEGTLQSVDTSRKGCLIPYCPFLCFLADMGSAAFPVQAFPSWYSAVSQAQKQWSQQPANSFFFKKNFFLYTVSHNDGKWTHVLIPTQLLPRGKPVYQFKTEAALLLLPTS